MNVSTRGIAVGLLVFMMSCAPKQNVEPQQAELSKKSEVQQDLQKEIKEDLKQETITEPKLKEAPLSKDKPISGDYIPDQIHLKLKKDQSKLPVFNAKQEQLGKYPKLDQLIETFNIKSIKPAFAGLDSKIYVISFDATTDVEALIKAAQQYDFVEYAEQIPLNK